MAVKTKIKNLDETMLKQKRKRSAEKQRSIGGNRRFTHAQITRLQKERGNSYVKQMLAKSRKSQKQKPKSGLNENREVGQASERVAKATQLQVEAPAKLSDKGRLQMNIEQAIGLQRYGELAAPFRNSIEKWRGSAQIKVGDEQFSLSKLTMENDGRLALDLGKPFMKEIKRMTKGKAKGKDGDLEMYRGHNATVKASMHYQAADPQLQSVEIPGKEAQLGHRQSKSGFFLKLEIKSVVIVSAEKEREEKEIIGDILLQGVVATE